MNPAIPLITTAVVLGATSGLTPGPLLTLVVAESFQRGFRSGAAVAIAPIITDAPIVLLIVLLANSLSSMDYVIGTLYLAGSAYLTYLSVEIFRIKGMEVDTTSGVRASFIKGVAANLLNPAPYIFWLTVGAPLLLQAKEISWMVLAAFIGFFYGLLVGTKLLLAVLIGRNRHILEGRYYIAVIRFMGIALLFFAAVFIKSGIDEITNYE
jgi:threonine/homoserine/homoserine lactone efflux protein